jgi:phosphoenolpyruvate synthase/pyruvate phosphate dikinase
VDSVRVGAKAANLAEMSRIPALASRGQALEKGLGVPFHYYESYMAQSQSSLPLCEAAERACASSGRDLAACGRARGLCAPEGGTSAPESFAALVDRVLRDASFRQDTSLRDAFLAVLRSMIEQTPVDPAFGVLLDRRVAEVFGAAKVKLRSSTNAEDLPSFSGAGLYNSYGAHASGGDAASKVVTKVFASVWTFRAFEERSFWNIDHQAVRMGCAINQAFTDEIANGVLITENIADPSVYGMYANVQKGEVSVTNPTNGALPEIFSILPDALYAVSRQRFSSLSPEVPLLSHAEVASLYEAGDLVRTHFSRLYGRSVILEVEFKLTPEHVIVFKQARPYATVSPWLGR